jgi:hypothetical protein
MLGRLYAVSRLGADRNLRSNIDNLFEYFVLGIACRNSIAERLVSKTGNGLRSIGGAALAVRVVSHANEIGA